MKSLPRPPPRLPRPKRDYKYLSGIILDLKIKGAKTCLRVSRLARYERRSNGMTEQNKSETLFKLKDVRLLRERLAWCFKKSPPMIQDQINKTLLQFAISVKEYCKCDEQVYVSLEGKNACLNCGARHDLPKDNVVT